MKLPLNDLRIDELWPDFAFLFCLIYKMFCCSEGNKLKLIAYCWISQMDFVALAINLQLLCNVIKFGFSDT